MKGGGLGQRATALLCFVSFDDGMLMTIVTSGEMQCREEFEWRCGRKGSAAPECVNTARAQLLLTMPTDVISIPKPYDNFRVADLYGAQAGTLQYKRPGDLIQTGSYVSCATTIDPHTHKQKLHQESSVDWSTNIFAACSLLFSTMFLQF